MKKIQAKIRQLAAEERKQGRTVFVKHQKLVVNGVAWIWCKKKNQLIVEAGERAASTKN